MINKKGLVKLCRSETCVSAVSWSLWVELRDTRLTVAVLRHGNAPVPAHAQFRGAARPPASLCLSFPLSLLRFPLTLPAHASKKLFPLGAATDQKKNRNISRTVAGVDAAVIHRPARSEQRASTFRLLLPLFHPTVSHRRDTTTTTSSGES